MARRKRKAKEAARVEVERKRRLLQENPALPRDFGLAHDHDKSLPAGALCELEYKCMECLKSFASSSDLLAHLVCHRPPDAPPSRKVQCVLCHVNVEPPELGTHLIKEHVNAKSKKPAVREVAAKPSVEVLCDICGKVLTSIRWKRIHMKYNHPGEDDDDEEDDGGGGGTKADFTHECSTCSGVFDSASDLYDHRAYHCSVCLRCSHCTEIFGSVRSLLKHCKLNHRERGEHLRFPPSPSSSPADIPGKRLNCPLCGHVSSECEEYGWHVSRAHGVRSIKCVNCDFEAAQFQEVVRHMTQAHGVGADQGICLVRRAVPGVS